MITTAPLGMNNLKWLLFRWMGLGRLRLRLLSLWMFRGANEKRKTTARGIVREFFVMFYFDKLLNLNKKTKIRI